MLSVNDKGVSVRLAGTPRADWSFALTALVGLLALGVAYVAITQPVMMSLGAIFVLACACFALNRYKAAQKNLVITGTLLDVSAGQLDYQGRQIKLDPNANISIQNNDLTIQNGADKITISGFETTKECQVVQAVLKGQAVSKKHAKIKMADGS